MQFRTGSCKVVGAAAAALAVLGLFGVSAAAQDRAGADTWPGEAAVRVADDKDVFGENLSGLSFESATVLWAVKNGPGTLYRLVPDSAKWVPDQADGWHNGKKLHYRDGSGDADAEGVVVTADGLFAATERDNDDKHNSKQEILRFDASSSAGSLNATGEWDLTKDLPGSDPNAGIEAISWVPDSYLTAHGFVDEHTGAAYDPATYPRHGSGLYFVGLESDGGVYGYTLDQSGRGYTRVATVASGFPALMELEFEPATGHLWALCDDTCDGQAATLDIDGQGAFAASAVYNRPGDMPNYNNEGFAIAPKSACAGGHKPVLWSDDSTDDGHALRGGTLSCTAGSVGDVATNTAGANITHLAYGTDGNGDPKTDDCTAFVDTNPQSAVDHAADGDVVCVKAGDYSGSTLTVDKPVTVRANGVVKLKNIPRQWPQRGDRRVHRRW